MKPNSQECCPKFEPNRWDEKTFNWEEKHFIKESIPTIFHIPFPKAIGNKVTKMMALAEKWDSLSDDKLEDLLLFNDPTAFKSDMYLSVSENVPSAHNVKISGTFLSKVYDGPYKMVPKFMKHMKEYLRSKDKKVKDYYVHYAYCPNCSKKFKNNYMVLFAEIEDFKPHNAINQ